MKHYETDVIIIGGGITGAGTLRDCSLRGINAILIEKNDLASGTTGRNHGLLHSGARYAVQDEVSAKECIIENKILKKIAPRCIEDTGGFFVTLDEDDPDYHDHLVQGCKKADIECEEISVAKALHTEPNLNPLIRRVLKVPDGAINPFLLTTSNIHDASKHQGRVLTHTKVVNFIVDQDRITGVECTNQISGESFNISGKMVVNASGIWAQQICNMAGIDFKMLPVKGAVVVVDYRINNVVVNRCRKPSDGDIFVPGATVSLIGNTSKTISYYQIESPRADDDEITRLLDDGEKLIPNVSKARILRAYSGVRPLVLSEGNANGRQVSRGIVLVDHEQRDGMKGLITIAGGKLMTYRLMAEMTTDLICKKLNVNKTTSTHMIPLPEVVNPPEFKKNRVKDMYKSIARKIFRPRQTSGSINNQNKQRIICECEMVSAKDIKEALTHFYVKDLVDLRRRVRVGMGPCQGALCGYRALGLFAESGHEDGHASTKMLIDFLEERWQGIKPVLWGDTLREIEFSLWIYNGLLGINTAEREK
jgi:glycerol-3-phosphate dehydrogenase